MFDKVIKICLTKKLNLFFPVKVELKVIVSNNCQKRTNTNHEI